MERPRPSWRADPQLCGKDVVAGAPVDVLNLESTPYSLGSPGGRSVTRCQ